MGKRVSYPALDRMKYAAAIMVIMIHCDTLIPQAETNFLSKILFVVLRCLSFLLAVHFSSVRGCR
ncbi:hypothetical protein [Enterococcus gallinarum]|uniref:hypothetical protein n=1 Tax=Enterococcus gallinarum TaxID=1353 RepID=UPI0021AF20A6|nr:hypothetical protein [Enterococcus gallinarum]